MSANFPGAMGGVTSVGNDPFMKSQLLSPGDALGGGLTQTDPVTGLPRGAVTVPNQSTPFLGLPGPEMQNQRLPLAKQPGFATTDTMADYMMRSGEPMGQQVPATSQPIQAPVNFQPTSEQIQNIGSGQQNLVQMLGYQSQPRGIVTQPPTTQAQQQPVPQPQPQGMFAIPGQVASLFQTQPQQPRITQPSPFPTLMQNPAFNPFAPRPQAAPTPRPPQVGRPVRRIGVSRPFGRR